MRRRIEDDNEPDDFARAGHDLRQLRAACGTGLERAQHLLSDLGLKERLNHLPKDLSGGEQQRVAIARALANEPKMILADEPTGNLDSKTGRQVIDLLCRIACEEKRSVVMVGHDERIKDIAHRTLWMEDGRIQEVF